MKKQKILFFVLLAAIVLVTPGSEKLSFLAGNVKQPLTIVVDAGHGGPDGGAEAVDGTQEADLNLAVAKALQDEGERRGMKVIMTRETEEGLYAEDNMERKWRKLEDMECRKACIEASDADVAVSIHMNCFREDSRVHGAQTFYPKTGNAEVLAVSEKLAEVVQTALKNGIRDGSNRDPMGKGDVYLLENPALPTVLVECGFLSNEADLARLKQENWQRTIARCILEGIRKMETPHNGETEKLRIEYNREMR